MPDNDKLTSSERKEQARETARQIRIKQAEKEKRTKFLIKFFAILVPILIVIGVVAVLVVNNNSKSSSTEVIQPANTVERGVLLGQGEKVLASIPKEPVGEQTVAPAHVAIYQDYMCPACKSFEESFADELKQITDEGVGVIELRTITFLDPASAGSNYSSRAANASYCVANTFPEKLFDYNKVLYANQPAELTTGLSNNELIQLAESVGATGLSDCVKDGTYRGWVAENNKVALEKPVKGTPTIVINGQEWDKQGSLYEAVKKAGAAPAIESATIAPAAPPALPSSTATPAAPKE